jgi:soluble lytic murein transglycosylase-like protein
MIWLVLIVIAISYLIEKKNLLDQIRSISVVYGVEWQLTAAIAWQESALDPGAIGDDGRSVGLMQVSLPTAEWLIGREISKDELIIPTVNIDLGVRYIKYQLERYGNDYLKAISAYNAGTATDANTRYVHQVMNVYNLLKAV